MFKISTTKSNNILIGTLFGGGRLVRILKVLFTLTPLIPVGYVRGINICIFIVKVHIKSKESENIAGDSSFVLP